MNRTRRVVSVVLYGFAIAVCARQALAATATQDETSLASAAPATAAQCVGQALAAADRGDSAERERLLAEASRLDADFAPARWLSGQIRYHDQWLTFDGVVADARGDETLGQYRALRDRYRHQRAWQKGEDSQTEKYVPNPAAERTLARWCQKHQLADETRAHATQLLASQSDDPEVLKMLDLTWHRGQLITTTALAERQQRDSQSKQALAHWRPLVSSIRHALESKSDGEHEDGLRQLRAIRDPAAIEALVAGLGSRPAQLCAAIDVIGQMPQQEATDALVQQALLAKDGQVVAAACQQLKIRSMFAYVPKLMAALSTPLRATHEVVRDDRGIHFRASIEREGENSVVAHTLDTQVGFLVPNPNLEDIIGQTYAQSVFNTQLTAQALVKINQRQERTNAAIYRVLDNTVGSRAADEPAAWWAWWHEYALTQTASADKPVLRVTYENPVYVPYVPTGTDDRPHIRFRVISHCSCFAQGTTVSTLEGPLPIERVQTGDRVLSQSPLSGELTFKPVLDVTRGRQEFLALEMTDGNRLVATGVHVFWVAGSGWRLTKELRVGDRLHTLSGGCQIQSIEPLPAAQTFNLVVADFNTFFVGDDRVLTHDVTLPDAVGGGTPGEMSLADGEIGR